MNIFINAGFLFFLFFLLLLNTFLCRSKYTLQILAFIHSRTVFTAILYCLHLSTLINDTLSLFHIRPCILFSASSFMQRQDKI